MAAGLPGEAGSPGVTVLVVGVTCSETQLSLPRCDQGDGDPLLAGSCSLTSLLLKLAFVSRFIWGGELGSGRAGGLPGLCSALLPQAPGA